MIFIEISFFIAFSGHSFSPSLFHMAFVSLNTFLSSMERRCHGPTKSLPVFPQTVTLTIRYCKLNRFAGGLLFTWNLGTPRRKSRLVLILEILGVIPQVRLKLWLCPRTTLQSILHDLSKMGEHRVVPAAIVRLAVAGSDVSLQEREKLAGWSWQGTLHRRHSGGRNMVRWGSRL